MQKFLRFDPTLDIKRLPLVFSLGDLSSIREIFTPEDGDIEQTQLPILPPGSENIAQNGDDLEGYLVEFSSAIMVALKEFLAGLLPYLEYQHIIDQRRRKNVGQKYANVKRACMNSLGIRLIEVIKQERRIGLYNLFWLMISQQVLTLLDKMLSVKGQKKNQSKIEIQLIIARMFQETLQQVRIYLQKEDQKRRHYSAYINETLASHLGATFNYEFSRSITTDQIHILFPTLSRTRIQDYAQAVITGQNDKYQISYASFAKMYSQIRSFMEKRIQQQDPILRELTSNVLKVSLQKIEKIPLEIILFHPTILSLFAEEIKQLPLSVSPKRSLFKSLVSPRLEDMFDDGAWEFAMNDYLTFARDLRRSEIVAFFRHRLRFVNTAQITSSKGLSRRNSAQESGSGIANKVSYQFDKGRIINNFRKVTLVFLDLRGFTELSAGDITDQELTEHLYNFFDPLVNIINHFGGTIKSYAGDGVMASFGTESWQKDHSLSAIRAAIEINQFFTLLKAEGKTAFKGMGIGIHTGMIEEAYFFPDPAAPSYNTVIGYIANLTGRLSSGKAEKHDKFDDQTVSTFYSELLASARLENWDPTSIQLFEEQLLQALNALQKESMDPVEAQLSQDSSRAVDVTNGILNNNGIAISDTTFQHITALKPLQEIEHERSVSYAFTDETLKKTIVLIKAGDATFKGIKEKFPVWGVYVR